jgi:hypothetical protein
MPVTYKEIATITVTTATQAAIEFSSIPSSYTDLVIKLSSRGDTGGPQNIGISFNGSTTGFSNKLLYGDGVDAVSTTTSTIFQGILPGTAYTANVFGNADIYIPNYAGSTNKTILSASSNDQNGAGESGRVVGLWRSTAAISTILITIDGSTTFSTGTTATLYGILKA